jgi:hypothetical protein
LRQLARRTADLAGYGLSPINFIGVKPKLCRALFFLRVYGADVNLRGKSRDQIEIALAHKSRSGLINLIYSLVTVEQLLKPAEIAARSCLNKRAVLRDIREGKFGDYYCRAENSIAVPASGVNEWRNRFRVPAKPKQEARR